MAFSHLLQYHNGCLHYLPPPNSSSSSSSFSTTTSTSLFPNSATNGRRWRTNRTSLVAVATTTTGSNPLWVEAWKPDNSPSPPLSDIFWPSAGY
ncbi:hypothetical protein LINPERHAP2_LOCUS32078 [Linum perenne]